MVIEMETLSQWLAKELSTHRISGRELARQADISHTSVADVIAGHRQPTWEFCASIAKPLGKSPIEIFKRAGLLPLQDNLLVKEAREVYEFDRTSLVDHTEDELMFSELRDLMKLMSTDERQEILDYARFRVQREQQQRKHSQ